MKHPNAQEVWKRVHTQSDPSGQGLNEREAMLQLLRQLRSDEALLHRGTLHAPPKDQLLLRQLAQAYREEAACIRGILLMTLGAAPGSGRPVSPSANLQSCYRNALQRLSFYTLRSADPLCGPVYRQLEQQTRQHCMILLQLIGAESRQQASH